MSLTAIPVRRPEALYLGGAWVEPLDGRLVRVVSPTTGTAIADAALAGPADVDRAVAAARDAFDRGPWPRLTPLERAALLERLAQALERREDDLMRVLALEVGTPVGALPQVQMCVQLLRDLVRLASDYPWVEERPSVEARYELRRAPVGVVAAVVPWNVPLFLGMIKLAPALLAGCTVVLKPAEETPLHAALLGELLEEVELPAGVVGIVPADRETSERLVRHPLVDKVSFTGSTAAGRRIGAICGEQLKRCSLELGGKSAAVILPDADVAAVVPELAPATMFNSGQMCANQTRVLAPAARYDEVVEALAAEIGGFAVGDPLDPATDIGPLVSERQRERVEGYIAAGRADGAQVVVGGGRPADRAEGWFVEPTVFAGADNDMRIAREEIFGPVVVVLPYRDEDDAVAIANDSPYGLAGSVWGPDEERACALARRLRTGNVGVNMVLLDVAVPFGGFKDSGIGREGGPEGLDAFVELQAIERGVT